MSLCNLIKDAEDLKPGITKSLTDKICAKQDIVKKIGILRSQACAHRWEAKTQQVVAQEAILQIGMMKDIVDLAQEIVRELADIIGGTRRENLEQMLGNATLTYLTNDARQVLRAFERK